MTQRNTFSILFYIKKEKTDKNNEAPIYMKVTINGQKVEYATHRRIDPAKWKPNGKLAQTNKTMNLLSHLEVLRAKAYESYTKLLSMGITPTARNVVEQLHGKQVIVEQKTLKQAIQAQYERVLNLSGTSFSESTATRYKTIIGHLNYFLPNVLGKTDIPLNELNYNFAEQYTTYLRTVRGCNHNSAMKYMKMLKAVIHYAQKQKWVTDDPFKDFECPIEKTETVYLTQEELNRIQEAQISIERLQTVRDIFVFACYTGLSYIDIANLEHKNIMNHSGHYLT